MSDLSKTLRCTQTIFFKYRPKQNLDSKSTTKRYEIIPIATSNDDMSSGTSTPASSHNPKEEEDVKRELPVNSSLENLQTEEQRRVLDTIAQVRKCGLESVLNLPQLVVCGDQSAGKSSVLEALTEIPFPRNDNLCTRFATEIHLRRADNNSLTIKVIPDAARTSAEQTAIQAFEESITDFSDLPRVMELAMVTMGIKKDTNTDAAPQAFARDTLSITVEGPTRPQLTLVDIPGLIATKSRGITEADVDLVAAITDHYISQSRTICLAVISATNDHSNQRILSKVQAIDPNGERTLGIITKPDGLASGSGSEEKFIELAKNEDIRLVLGWHVLKNRKFEEKDFSLLERNLSEAAFFKTSNFKCLPSEQLGIDSLRLRLSRLLFEHVKRELPNLRRDLDNALAINKEQLGLLGDSRTTASECKLYLARLSLRYSEICKSAINGHYEGSYFRRDMDPTFSLESASTIRRTRAVVQFLNNEFSSNFRINGQKYKIDMDDDSDSTEQLTKRLDGTPETMTRKEALKWVSAAMIRNRGQELPGNFNPLLVGELFWEQASKWQGLAEAHLDKVSQICGRFLEILFRDNCPRDVHSRIWNSKIQDALNARKHAATVELGRLIEDLMDSYPINYNHYYTDTINKRRQDRQTAAMVTSIEGSKERAALNTLNGDQYYDRVNVKKAAANYAQTCDPNMDNFGCEEALDCLFAIYKVQQKTFVANVTTQVIERHIVRGLDEIFSPLVVTRMGDTEAEAIACEPSTTQTNRKFLVDRVKKLEAGREIFKGVM